MPFEPPFPPYDPRTYEHHYTIYRIDHDLGVSTEDSTLSLNKEQIERKIEEGKGIIEKISKLKYEMARDRALEPIPQDGEAYVEEYNNELENLAQIKKNTWFTAPWLFAECYLYRLLRSYINQTTEWKDFDPFAQQKEETFRSSGKAIYHLATTMHELEEDKESLKHDADKLGIIFKEMIQMCLWGNATDLSLLTHLSKDDIAHLQTVGRDAQAARKEFILKDDQDKVWDYLKCLKGEVKVDFVLDNAGFELFTDFVFADFLVTYTPYVSKVVFHPKLIPWFVSDVTPADFKSTIPSLLSNTFFPYPSSIPDDGKNDESEPVIPPSRAEEHDYLRAMVLRWKDYIDKGIFELSVSQDLKLGGKDPKADFWTSPWPYWDIQERAPEIFDLLKESGLVVLKGDLNYRKLTGDIRWPVSTPFETALGPLAGSLPILSLRTNKADVVVGVDEDVAKRLDDQGEKWRVNGKYALVSFVPRKSE
ncbi:Sugar phosphate phosphatase [Abortiporus biennis]